MNDEERLWYCINGYNGYEFSNDGLLRSMKNYVKNPYGKLLTKHSDKLGDYYYLTDDNNDRQKVYVENIERIIRYDKNLKVRRTNETDISSRNKLVPTKKQKAKNNYVGFPDFAIQSDYPKPKMNALRFY